MVSAERPFFHVHVSIREIKRDKKISRGTRMRATCDPVADDEASVAATAGAAAAAATGRGTIDAERKRR